MFGVTPLRPAYGRDYKSKKALQADFAANKDFIAANGRYINREQIQKLKLPRVEIRYDRARKVAILSL